MQQEQRIKMQKQLSIPLIQSTQHGLSFSHQAMKFISSLPNKKCHILTIIGKTKTGKSTLMNQLFKSIAPINVQEKLFEVNDGIGGGTKGACILRKYIELDDDSILLLVDTQGLGNLGNSQSYQISLFACFFLLSTTVIYNTLGPIDEQTLNNLSIFIQVGKMLEKNVALSKHKRNATPSLFMVLRDFGLKLENKIGDTVTANKYLEDALEEQSGVSQAMMHKNRIRRSIKELFHQRQCETMVLPSEKLPVNFNEEIRPEFVEDLHRFSDKIISFLRQQPRNSLQSFMPSELTKYIAQLIGSISSNLPGNILKSGVFFKKQISNVTDNFKNNIAGILKDFSSHADYIEDAVNSAEYFAQFQEKLVYDNITKLQANMQNLEQNFNQSYAQLMKISNQRQGNDSTDFDPAQIKIIVQIKQLKEQEMTHRIKQLHHIIAQKRKITQVQLKWRRQQEAFKVACEQITLVQEDRQLDKKYRSFILALKDHCSGISSIEFQAEILKLQVAYLRRKLQLKERQPFSCHVCKSNKTQDKRTRLQEQKSKQMNELNPEKFLQDHTLKQKQNNLTLQMSFNKSKTIKQIEGEKLIPQNSFYVPYVHIIDATVMNVQIIRTLIKQDSKSNNYIEYVLQVVLMKKRWQFNRRWKDFNELHSILSSLFQTITLPSFPNAVVGLGNNSNLQKEEIEERRKKLEIYLRKVLQLEPIRNSRIMQKFVKINKQYVCWL